MKLAFALLVIAGLSGCAKTRSAPANSGGAAGQTRRVYFQGKGPDQEVRRFQKILEIALDDNHLQRVDSTKDADAVVKATITIEEKTTHLYIPRVLATVVSTDNKRYELEQCNGMSNREEIYSREVDYVDSFELPSDWTQARPHFAVYIDESKFKGYEQLIAAFKKRLAEKGYKVANDASGSDGKLSSIMMQRMDVPMSVLSRRIRFEVFDKDGNRYYYTSGGAGTDTSYLGVTPPFKLETLPCRNQIKTFKSMDVDDGSWRDARGIAHTISERINKTLEHSN